MISVYFDAQFGVTQVQFVSKTKYYFGKGYVELCLNEHIRPYVLELKERFTEIELGYAIRLSSFYAIRIYELLKCSQYRQGGFDMALEELRAELGNEKGKLERIDNFKAKVMNIAEREILKQRIQALGFRQRCIGKERSVGIGYSQHAGRWRCRSIERISSFRESARARPSAATASSMVPYASVTGSAFDTRPPYSNPVVPSSPVFV